MDLDGLAVGAIIGLIAGALLFTSTGRTVSRAAGERVAYHVKPKKRR